MVMYGTSKVEDNPELMLDKPEEISFCKAIESLGPTPEGTIRLFDRQEYYSAHGTDALYIAHEVYRTTTVVRYLGARSSTNGPTEGLASCTLRKPVAINFLKEALTAKALRIEIYSNGHRKGPSEPMETNITQASPGNLQDVEDLLFTDSDLMEAPVLMAVRFTLKANTPTCGIAFVDTSTRSLGVSEYVDNELFSNTEALLIQLGVKEVLLPVEDKVTGYECNKLRQVIDRCNVVVTERKKVDFTIQNIEQDLNRLLKDDTQAIALPEFDMKNAMSAAAAVIIYLNLLSDVCNHGAFSLSHHDLSCYMRLDASALRALHLMPESNGLSGSGAKSMSLFGLLNGCKTSQGARMLHQWLKQPLVNLHEIIRRQCLVQVFVEDHELRSDIQASLRKMPDLHKLSKRLKRGNASLENVVRVYQAILELPSFIELLNPAMQQNTDAQSALIDTYLRPLHTSNDALRPYADLVETTVDLKELDNHNYVIKAEYDANLRAIRDHLAGICKALDEEHAKVAADLGLLTDNKTLHFEVNQIYGHCLRLTRKESGVLRGKKGYIELGNRNNGVFFTNSSIRQLAQDYRDHSQRYERKQSSLVREVIDIAASYSDVLEPLNDRLAHLDVIVSFAHIATSLGKSYVRPVLNPMGVGDVHLVGSRHPCLEVQDGVQFIANDVDMIRDQHELIILSGPNMCGKSTYIRQIGCIALMAQIGSYVPCTAAELPIFDMILCRVGAGDSQLKGISTFMAEMLETATILKSATKHSLVIVDELGRGTSTYDGFGLAWAISEYIATKIHAFCLFATHFHELSSLANRVTTVRNLHVQAHVEDRPGDMIGKDVVLLYQVAPGPCDKSFGIHVAELAKFPEEVIKHAKRKADELEDFGNEIAALPGFPVEQAAEGVNLVRNLCREWATRDTLLMRANTDLFTSNAERFKRLQACFEEAKPQLEANRWFQHVVSTL